MFGGKSKKELRDEIEHYHNLWTRVLRENDNLRSEVLDLKDKLETEQQYFQDTMRDIGQAFVRVGEGQGMVVTTYEYEEDN